MRHRNTVRAVALALLTALLLGCAAMPALAEKKTVRMMVSSVYTPKNDGHFRAITKAAGSTIKMKVGQALCVCPDTPVTDLNAAWVLGDKSEGEGFMALKCPGEDGYAYRLIALGAGDYYLHWEHYSSTGVDISTKPVHIQVIEASVRGVAIQQGESATVVVNETLRLWAQPKPSIAKTSFSWTSDKPEVATVTSYGLVTAVKPGAAKVTVKTDNGKKAVITIKVVAPKAPKSVKINAGNIEMKRGQTRTLATTLKPATARSALTWKSSKPSVVKVSADGEVTALRVGKAKITAITENKKRASITVTVSEFSFDQLSRDRYNYFRRYMSDDELRQAYAAAVKVVTQVYGLSLPEQLQGIPKELRRLVDSGMTYSMSSKHYRDPYGYFILKEASCAGCVRATGLCLNILGIPYEHVNENKYSHQWARVKVGDTYWICDAFGLYCGPEPGERQHPMMS